MTDCPSPCLFLLLGGGFALTTLESCRGGFRTLPSEVTLLDAAQTQKGTPGLRTLPLHVTRRLAIPTHNVERGAGVDPTLSWDEVFVNLPPFPLPALDLNG